MNYSMTQAGNVVKLVSGLLVLFGAHPFSEEETNAVIVVIGLIGEAVGFVVSWWGRYRKGDVNVVGFRR